MFLMSEEESNKHGWFKVTAAIAKPGDILYDEGIDGVDFAMFEQTVLKVENGLIYSVENCDPQYIPLSQRGVHEREYLWRNDTKEKHRMPEKFKHLLEG